MHAKRFGVSIEPELLDKLDRFVQDRQFPNRSQAIRFLIHKNTIEQKWENNQLVAGTVVLVYDHHRRDLQKKSTEIQHGYHDCILSVMHVHLDHDNCIETIVVKGKAHQLVDLSNKLIGLKGVKHGELVISTGLQK